jgi:hypothetical protein
MDKNRTTSKTGRRLGKREIVENDVIQFIFTALGVVKIKKDFLLGSNQRIVAIALLSYFT